MRVISSTAYLKQFILYHCNAHLLESTDIEKVDFESKISKYLIEKSPKYRIEKVKNLKYKIIKVQNKGVVEHKYQKVGDLKFKLIRI